jgi:hypothetical protein
MLQPMKELTPHGHKKITLQNWLEPDSATLVMGNWMIGIPGKTPSPESWFKIINQPTLSSQVPQGLAAIYECARGMFFYSYYYYPLFTLAYEHSLKVVEEAIKTKCGQCNIAITKPTKKGKLKPLAFAELLESLHENHSITDQQKTQWQAAWKLRCMATHPKTQSILAPEQALDMFHTMAEILNALFATDNK